MRFCQLQLPFLSSIMSICGLMGLLMGCTTLGPQYIATGRAAYNDVINYTEDQQMLMAIVRSRYGETISMLAVTNVTANIRFTAAAEGQFGLGPDKSYETNLIPLSTGLAFEDNPTISYVPVEGEEQFDRLMAPVPLKDVIILARNLEHNRLPVLMLVQSIHYIQNPKFIHPPKSDADPRFMRVMNLMDKLEHTGHLDWARDPEKEDQFSMVIRNTGTDRTAEIRELFDLLGVKQKPDGSKPLFVPVFQAVVEPETGGVSITTHSIYDIIEMLSASVDVPDKHRESGLALTFPPPGLAARQVRIHRSESKPDKVAVAIEYRNSWYYIAENDQDTKLMFKIVRTLWQDRIAATTQFQSAPVLTIPVSQ